MINIANPPKYNKRANKIKERTHDAIGYPPFWLKASSLLVASVKYQGKKGRMAMCQMLERKIVLNYINLRQNNQFNLSKINAVAIAAFKDSAFPFLGIVIGKLIFS